MEENKDRTLMRTIDVNKFNEDMELIQKYSELIRNMLIKMTVHKEFYLDELPQSRHIINCIIGYSQIIRKNDLESARNYLRTTVANGCTAQMPNNISEELQSILDNDKYWNEEIVKIQVENTFSEEEKEEIASEVIDLFNNDK